MDWKTKVLLFVLVLFGSVVPVSAQVPPASGGTVEGVNWELIAVGLAFVTAFLLGWNTLRGIAKDNRDAHEKIGDNIKGVKTELKADIKGVEGKVDDGFKDLNSDIKDLNRSVGRLEGSLQPFRRPSEGGQD